MGIFDRFRKEPAVEIMTKEPGFAITQFHSNNPFSYLTQPEINYFDQYILYTYKCIDYIASKVASSPIHLYNANQVAIDDNPLFQDLKSFNPYMNLWEARKLREIHLMLVGTAYWYIDRHPSTGGKVAYYPLDPTKMQMKTDARGLPDYYQYLDADGVLVELSKEDVIYFKRMNPANWFQGLSQVRSLQFWTNAHAQGSQYNMNKLGNNANADKFVVFEGVSEDVRQKLEAQLQNKYGGMRNAGRTGILNKKPEVVDVSGSQKDLDYVQGMKMLRQDIMVGFGIPESLFFPSATNSNSRSAITLFQSDTLEPLMQQESAALNEQLIPRYELKTSLLTKNTVYFGFNNVVEADKSALVTQATSLFDSGVYTRDQALVYIGDKPIGGELGAEYKAESSVLPPEVPPVDPEKKQLEQKSITMMEQLNKMVEQLEQKEFMQKNIKLADAQEGIMYNSSEALFQKQFKDSIQYIDKTEKPTVRGVFNMKDAVSETKDIFKESYAKVITNSNDVGNVEIQQKLLKINSNNIAAFKVKSLSGNAIDELAKHLDYFATELSETTQTDLRKLIATGIQEGFDKTLFRKSLEELFNGYIDGEGNENILRKAGFYIPSVEADNEGNVITHTGARYRQMFNDITKAEADNKITAKQRDDLLKALRGLVDPSDSTGKLIDDLLDGYNIPKDKGITFSRTVTIARTEATYARNLGFDDTYSDNPFVKGKMWKSLHDADVRDAHADANGQVVPVGEAFDVGGYKMKFPGDGSLGAPANLVINDRCRITAVVE